MTPLLHRGGAIKTKTTTTIMKMIDYIMSVSSIAIYSEPVSCTKNSEVYYQKINND